jgi:hypothetical protein
MTIERDRGGAAGASGSGRGGAAGVSGVRRRGASPRRPRARAVVGGAVALYLALLGLLGYRTATGSDPAVDAAAARATARTPVVGRVEQRRPATGAPPTAAPAPPPPAPAAPAAPLVTRSS